jgi:hypothetical protein
MADVTSDAAAEAACEHFQNIASGVQQVYSRPPSFGTSSKDVHETALASEVPAITIGATKMLADVTGGPS